MLNARTYHSGAICSIRANGARKGGLVGERAHSAKAQPRVASDAHLASAVRRTTSAFFAEDRGAVTVDWVVLTAALVAVGLATAGVVASGINDLSNATADELSGTEITTRFPTISTLFEGDFSNGLGAFLGGTATSLAGFGDVLQLGAGETAELTVSVPPGAETATFSFDLIAGDDLDGGDTATIMINGQAVSLYEDNHGNVSVGGNAPSGITVEVDHQSLNANLGAGAHGHDSVSTYTVTVDNPGTNVTLGVNSGADEGVSNEFFALDNVNVTSS